MSNLSASVLPRGSVFVARRGRVHPNFWLKDVIFKVNAARRNREKNLRTQKKKKTLSGICHQNQNQYQNENMRSPGNFS